MKEKIIARLEKILYEGNVLRAKDEIERNKQAYQDLLTHDGKEVAIFTTDPLDQSFEELVSKLKIKEENILLRQKNENELVIFEKKEIIRDLKKLLNSTDNIGQSYEQIKEIQERWNKTARIKFDEESENQLQNDYNYQVELFYHNIKINRELRDIDYQRNLKAKQELIKEAEKLHELKEIRDIEQAVRKLQNEWRFTGPVQWELKDSIYEEFRGHCDKAYSKVNAFYDSRRDGLDAKLREKIALCEKVHGLANEEVQNPKTWIANTEKVLEVQKEWKKVGFSSENETIWEVFRNACDSFFEKKRSFFAEIDSLREENLKKKQDLIQRVEGMKASTDWQSTTEKFLALQKEWQAAGSAGRKNETKLWNQFRSACDHFFNAKRDFYTAKNGAQEENLKVKEDLINQIEKMELSTEPENDFLALKQISAKWNDTGFVPFNKKDELIQQYRAAMEEKYKALRLNESERKELEFQNRVHKLMRSDNPNQIINMERRKIQDKIDRLRAQINQYENNIGFFGNASEDSPVIKDIRTKMQSLKTQVDDLQSKLITMRSVVQKSKDTPKEEVNAKETAEANADADVSVVENAAINADASVVENTAINADEPVAENAAINADEPVAENAAINADEPVAENAAINADEPVAEANADAPTTEADSAQDASKEEE